MPKQNLPKIQIGTARNVAKNLISDKYGHAVSDTKLKQFLKTDKDLQRYVYKNDRGTLSKFQASKFFNKVVDTAKTSGSFKVSRLAQKMGIKPNAPRTTNIQLNKIYQHASQTEYDATPHQTGPTPAEQAKAHRREKMLKTLHKQDRAYENQREQAAADAAKEKQNPQSSKSSNAAPPRVSGIGSVGAPPHDAASSTAPTLDEDSASTTDPRLPCLVYPLENQTPNVPGFELTVSKFNTFIKQHLTTTRLFRIISDEKLWNLLGSRSLDTIPSVVETDARRALAHGAGATVYIDGAIRQFGQKTELRLTLRSITNATEVTLAHLTEPMADRFEFQRKIAWQIDAALANHRDQDTTTPSSTPAIELPI
ncbi:MAG: hypothetical protein HZC01_01625 [Candidatus Kerfeldbacteria bacterium]|nr:hypothetical protein [Candidatus Kerfeldbacteria bacterium]